jgi:hypothetical protein
MAQDLGIGPQREIIQLPDGTRYDMTDATEEERRAIAELYRQQEIASPSLSQLVEDFPKGLRYGEVEADPERTPWGHISQFALGIPRGMTQTGLSLLGGIAGLTSLDEDTDLEKRIRVAQRKTREGFWADPDYEDAFARKGGEAIGSGLAYMGGAGLMRKGLASLPLSASIKAAPTIATLRLQRLFAGSSPGAARGWASRFFAGTAQQAALTAPLSVPIQMGQHAAQVHNYELLTGEDIPRDVEKAGYLKSIGPGLTEAIGIGAFGGRTGSAFGREAIRKSMQQGSLGAAGEKLGWAIAGAGEEALQEIAQAFMSARIASSYDDEAMGRMAKEMKEGAQYGGFAGFVLSGLLHQTSRSIGKNLLGIDLSSNTELQRRIMEQRLLRPLGSNPTQEQIRKRQVQQQRDRNYERIFARSQNQFGTADPTLTEEEQAELRQNLLDIYVQEVTAQEENKVAEDNTYQPLNEADIEIEAQRRTEQRYQDDQRFYQESLQNEEDVRTEVGLTFAELDKIGAKPIQELLGMVSDGDLTLEELKLVTIADRLSRAGGVDRDEIRDFAIRTTDVNNRFDSGAVASFILMSDPAFIAERTRQVADVEVQQELNRRIEEAQRQGKKPPTKLTKKVEQGIRDEIVNNATSVDLFGEGTGSQKFATAKQILVNAFPTSYLNSQNALTKPYLTPAEVNSLIAEVASKTKGLDANKVYDLLYENRGTLALSDAVEKTSDIVVKDSRPATPEEREAFKDIGEQQRDVPEDAMLRVYDASGGGVLAWLSEHVGDLTHRMTHDMGGPGIAKMDLTDKINKTLREMAVPSFESDVASQLRRNARDKGVSPETLQADTDAALAEYAEAHRALPAYNEMQRLARDAAVAIGEKNFGEATRLLQELQTIVNSKDFATALYSIEVSGNIEQATLPFTDPAAQEVVVLAQEGVKALEGTQKQFETAIMDLLEAKNISLKYGTTKFGTSGLEGTAFTALVQKVLGHNSIKQVKSPAQRRMLYGHLMNMPTFPESTILPDLSDPLYTPDQFMGLLNELSFIEDPMIRIDRLFERMNKRGVPESEIKNSEYPAYLQAIRHGLDSGYIISRGTGQNIRIGFAEDNRSHARTPAIAEQETQRAQFEQDQQARRAEEDQDRREYEQREKDRLNKESKLQENLETFERLWIEQLKGWGVPQEYLEGVFTRDVTDPILRALVGSETNVIDNPEQLQNRLAEFNTDTGQLLINLSFADPSGTRDPMEIIQDLKPEVFEGLLRLGALTQPDVDILDKQLKVQIVPEELWKEFASPELEYQEMTFLQFSDMIEPDAGQAEVMESARGLLMRSLMKNQLSPAKTAGRVGTIKGLIQSAFGQQIEASRTSGIAPLINILNRFEQGLMAQPPGVAPLLTPRTIDGEIRNTTGLDYISPELRKSLRQAMLLNDTQAQDEAIEKILRTERTDETLADAPTESWETSTFGRILYEEELNSTVPGTIPDLGPNASENAIEAYFAQKLGRTPYIMPPVAKSRFRNKVSWTPNAELTELIEKHGGENITKSGKLIYEQMADNIQERMKEYDVDKLDELTEADKTKLFEGTKKIIEESQRVWMKNMTWADNLLGHQVFTRAYRSLSHSVLNDANPAEIRDQERAYRNNELRSIAEMAMASALIFRNQSMNLATNTQRVGAIVYVGTAENGAPMIVERTGPDQASLNDMFVLLPTAQDISYASVYGGALRFLALNENITLAKQELEKARLRGDLEEIAFFAANTIERPWTTVSKEDAGGNIFVPNADGEMSKEEQIEAAQRIVDLINEQNPDIKRFFELYAEYNENVQIPFQLQTGILTPEMAEFAKKQSYVPLIRDIGDEASYNLGSNGRPIVGKKTIQVDDLYSTMLTGFSDIDKVDIVKSIQTYNYRMINEALTNVAAIRAVKDFEEATAAGLGIQSINITEAVQAKMGEAEKNRKPPPRMADVIRLKRNGRVEYHQVADPQVASAVMTTELKPVHYALQKLQRVGEFTRNTVVRMPDFIFRNFAKDQQQFTDIHGGSTGEYLPQVGLLKGLLKATSPDALLRMRKAGFATDSPMSYNIQLLEAGGGQTTYSGRSMTGEEIAKDAIKVERFNQWAEKYMKEGKLRPESMSDMMALLSVGYRNLMTMSEGTARLSAHDLTLARTGSPAQAMLDGYELMNYGKRGGSSFINVFMSTIPFLRGGAIGLDTTLRAFAATPDAPGAHLADSRVHYRNQFYTRLMMGALSHVMYRALWDGLGDEDDNGRSAYDRASTYDKMNYILVPTPGPIPMKLPTKFLTGLFTNTIAGAVYDHTKYKDFTAKDALGEIGERAFKELTLPTTGPLLKALMNQYSNRDSFTGEPITPAYLENLPSEYQYTPQTSYTARLIAEGLGVIPGFDPNGPEVEQFARDIGTTLATVMLAVSDRAVASNETLRKKLDIKGTIGTPHDWDLGSLFGGPGIQNLPLLEGQLGEPPEIDAAMNEKYYELSDFFEVYNSLVRTLESRDDPDDTIEKHYKNADDVAKYEEDFGDFRRYMNAHRVRIDRIINENEESIQSISENPSLEEAEKNERIERVRAESRAKIEFEQKHKSDYLQGLTDIMLGIQATDNPDVKGAV